MLELLINVNKQHEEYIHTTQDIIFTENDLELEKENNLEKLVSLNSDAIDLTIQNRTEGPLTPEMIKFGYPNILKENETQENSWYSDGVKLFNESVVIQKIAMSILINIGRILNKVWGI